MLLDIYNKVRGSRWHAGRASDECVVPRACVTALDARSSDRNDRWHAVLRADKAERERYARSAVPRLPMDMNAVGMVAGYTSRAPAECREVSSDATSIGRRE